MEIHWLFDFPNGESSTKVERYVSKRLKADPVAAAIPTEEAEAFLAAAVCLQNLSRQELFRILQSIRIRVHETGERDRRKAVLMALQRWTLPRYRRFLSLLPTNISVGPMPDVARFPDLWTLEGFRRAYHEGNLNIVWLVVIRRSLGPLENLSEWLASVDTQAEKYYRTWLDIGRLTWRRILRPEPAKAAPAAKGKKSQATAQAALVAEAADPPAALAQELREKEQRTGALRQDVRRLEQDRKYLREQARRSQLQASTALSQARGDLAGEQKALQAQLAAQQMELAERVQVFGQQIQVLRMQIGATRADFERALAGWRRRRDLHVLKGRTVTLVGPVVDKTQARLQVESLGGRLVSAGGDLVLTAPVGAAALEQSLRHLALRRVQIKTDGLYRKKTTKPGVAISGFQASFDGIAGQTQRAVTCCGSLASSLMGEYGGVVMALHWFLSTDPPPGSELEVLSDCKVMLNLINAKRLIQPKRGCVTLNLMVWQARRQLERRGCTVRFRWVPREEVHAVDRLCASLYQGLGWYRGRVKTRPQASLDDFLQQVRQGVYPQ